MPVLRAPRNAVLRGLTLVVAAAVALPALALPPVAVAAPGDDTAGSSRRIVTGWMPYWTTEESLESYLDNADLFSEISPFWYSTRGTSSNPRVEINPYADPQIKDPDRRGEIVAQLKSGGAKVVPSVVDGTSAGTLAAVMADPDTRTDLVRQLVDLTLDEGYDGIDLDYEGFAFHDGRSTWSSTRPNWVAFVTELGDALHAEGKILTVAVPSQCNTSLTDTKCGGTNGYWVYDILGIAPAIDRVRIMAYDYSWDRPGPIGPYPWTKAIAAWYASQIPPEKVQIGAPTYGRDWVRRDASGGYLVSGSCPASTTSTWNKIIERTAPDAVAIPGILERNGNPPVTYDETSKESWFRYERDTVWTDSSGTKRTCTAQREVWFDGAESALARTELVGEYDLGGVAFWTIGGEDADQWAPIRAYAQSLAPASTTVDVTHPSTAVYGAPVTVVATARSSGTAVAGATATLMSRAAGRRGWTPSGTAVTGPDGVATFSVKATSTLTWRVKVAATDSSTAVDTGAVGDTRIRALVTAVPPTAPVAAGADLPLRGRVAPGAAGVKVRVQVQEGTAWRTVARSLTADRGRIRVRFTAPETAGEYTYRVRSAGTTNALAGTSATVAVTVAPAPTDAAATDPAPADPTPGDPTPAAEVTPTPADPTAPAPA